MTSENLKLVGNVAIGQAVLGILVAVLELAGSIGGGFALVLNIVIAAMGIFVILNFKKFLNERHQFSEVDPFVTALIVAGLVGVPVGYIAEYGAGGSDGLLLSVVVVYLVFFGAVLIVFGVKLLRLPDSLGGYLKPFCYLYIASGICVVTVLLAVFGVLLGAVADIILGLIFFEAAKSSVQKE